MINVGMNADSEKRIMHISWLNTECGYAMDVLVDDDVVVNMRREKKRKKKQHKKAAFLMPSNKKPKMKP